MIAAVGTYVVGGNYVIGLIVFLILVVVQYVVVTNGAQRVAEVAARFTLDSMPGQQMSIDADLNMGLIDQDEAKRRRKKLEKEASFYGAMDGASKFVKGDAIAGIIIMLINIIGGLVIGVLAAGHALGRGAADLHAADHRRRHRDAGAGAGDRGGHRHHRHALGLRQRAWRRSASGSCLHSRAPWRSWRWSWWPSRRCRACRHCRRC